MTYLLWAIIAVFIFVAYKVGQDTDERKREEREADDLQKQVDEMKHKHYNE